MPRKTALGFPLDPVIPLASMRPRPDAAENVRLAARPCAIHGASMRPRPDAAENMRTGVVPSLKFALQ